MALVLAGCSACSSGTSGGGGDGGTDGATPGKATSVVGQLTVVETGESFAYKPGNHVGGCASGHFEVLLTSTKDNTAAMNVAVFTDGSVQLTAGSLPLGKYTGTGATSAIKPSGTTACAGTVTLSKVPVKSSSDTFTIDGKLDFTYGG